MMLDQTDDETPKKPDVLNLDNLKQLDMIGADLDCVLKEAEPSKKVKVSAGVGEEAQTYVSQMLSKYKQKEYTDI